MDLPARPSVCRPEPSERVSAGQLLLHWVGHSFLLPACSLLSVSAGRNDSHFLHSCGPKIACRGSARRCTRTDHIERLVFAMFCRADSIASDSTSSSTAGCTSLNASSCNWLVMLSSLATGESSLSGSHAGMHIDQ